MDSHTARRESQPPQQQGQGLIVIKRTKKVLHQIISHAGEKLRRVGTFGEKIFVKIFLQRFLQTLPLGREDCLHRKGYGSLPICCRSPANCRRPQLFVCRPCILAPESTSSTPQRFGRTNPLETCPPLKDICRKVNIAQFFFTFSW